jgi:Zn-finger nucleic acid-binding protein
MAGKQPPAAEQQSVQGQTYCPHCNTPLLLPPNVRYGMCPSCNGKIEVDSSGIPQKYIEPPQPQPQPEIEIEPPKTVEPPQTSGETAQQKYRKKKTGVSP